MESYKSPAAFAKDVQVPIDKSILQNLLPASCKLELSEKTRILNLLSADAPHILASLTLLSPGDCRKMLQEAEQVGPKTLKRELKPVHRALCGLRAKLNNLSPYLKISLIRDLGYALIRAENKDL